MDVLEITLSGKVYKLVFGGLQWDWVTLHNEQMQEGVIMGFAVVIYSAIYCHDKLTGGNQASFQDILLLMNNLRKNPEDQAEVSKAEKAFQESYEYQEFLKPVMTEKKKEKAQKK